MIDTLIHGRDGIVRAARLRSGKNYIERAIQHLYPLELRCDATKKINSSEPLRRSQRGSSAAARLRVKDLLHGEQEEPDIE